MNKSLVVNCNPREIRVGLIEEGQIVEMTIERRNESGIVGNIYKGLVTRVLPGMQAAFIDIGLERAAFLYVADVVDAKRDIDVSMTRSDPRMESSHRPIQHLLSEGQEIMVQVAKEPIGTKGARVTSHVSIAGRHLVYMPTIEHIGISRRIGDEEERRRLKDILEALVPQGGGFVARTAAEGKSPEELGADLEFLSQVWNDILNRMDTSSAPVTLYEDLDLLLRTARDVVTTDLDEIIVDDPAEFERLVDFMNRFMPRYAARVRHHNRKESLFDAYGLEVELNRALSRKVWLASGGYLIIDQTEALTAIDVNTGRFVGKRNLADTILKTNLEAVDEIVRQLRLRNIGGIIIIDFIDMDAEASRQRVYSNLSLALEKDRARTNTLKVSDLGLVEMTRKRVRESLIHSVSEPCFYCDGSGLLKSRATVIQEVYRALVRHAPELHQDRVRLRLHPRVAASFETTDQDVLHELESVLGRQIIVEETTDIHLEHFEFVALDETGQTDGRHYSGPKSAP
ncbi:MAG: Rne/Rng family ribonuclease [Myxococcota bacterium]|nr:Rne/Rng family ribonuclease [Myxococcota bacterium]